MVWVALRIMCLAMAVSWCPPSQVCYQESKHPTHQSITSLVEYSIDASVTNQCLLLGQQVSWGLREEKLRQERLTEQARLDAHIPSPTTKPLSLRPRDPPTSDG